MGSQKMKKKAIAFHMKLNTRKELEESWLQRVSYEECV